MSRSGNVVLVLLAAFLLAAGCGESSDGDFREYSGGDSVTKTNQSGNESTQASIVKSVSIQSDAITTNDDSGTADPKTASIDDTPKKRTDGGKPADEGDSTEVSQEPIDQTGKSAGGTQAATDVANVANDATADPELKNGLKREIELLIPKKEFQADAQGVIRVSYDDIDLLKVLNMEPVPLDAVKHFPDWLNELDGKTIRIRGFMFPPSRDQGIEIFQLARDNEICCFGKQAKIYDKFPVTMKEGVTTHYIFGRPFDVVGTFRIDPFSFDDEELFELYKIEDAIVIEK